MKVGIIGSGGREHAICESIKKSSKIDKIFLNFGILHVLCLHFLLFQLSYRTI